MGIFIGTIPTPPRVMSQNEQKRLLKVTGEHRDGFRDHMIFALALATGLREHELVALNGGDIYDDKGKVRHRFVLRVFKRSAKAPAMQEVVLSETIRRKLAKYRSWKLRENQGVDVGDPIFISKKGNRLSTRQVRRLLRNWQERAGLDRPYNFHSLRHSACTNLYQQTKDIRLTQRFARHSSIISTQRYAHATLEELVRAVQNIPC